MTVVEKAAAIGVPADRIEAREKVTGQARYAYEYEPDGVVYAVPVSSTIARGEIVGIEPPDGVLAVISHQNCLPLQEVDDRGLLLFQSPDVAFRGEVVAAVVCEHLEAARAAAAAVKVEYRTEPHDVILREDHPGLYAPESVNGGYPTDAEHGDVEAALGAAEVTLDATYTTPAEHNNAMEPHASLALWEGDDLTVYDSNQGTAGARDTLSRLFGIDREHVRVISTHVGGGFGSKGTIRPQIVIAAMAARMVGRPVKVAFSRQEMFHLTGYRTPTIQRMRLGAKRDGELTAIAHAAMSQTSNVREFTEQSATPTRVMYAAPNRLTTHRVVALDVPTPSWMRAPGECPGMFALESAMDELADELGIDPIELRIRNEPPEHPESGKPWSSRSLVACLREGAERFGWREPAGRDGRCRAG